MTAKETAIAPRVVSHLWGRGRRRSNRSGRSQLDRTQTRTTSRDGLDALRIELLKRVPQVRIPPGAPAAETLRADHGLGRLSSASEGVLHTRCVCTSSRYGW